MITLVVLQPSYLPWLGYFDQMQKADIFVWYDDVQFDKQGWRNRNRIKGLKGPIWLTVPVLHKGRSAQAINTIEVDNRMPWARKHLASIRQLYARAPFTAAIATDLGKLLDREWRRLVDLNIATTTWLAEELAIKTPRYMASDLDVTGDRNTRLVNLCKHFGANRYLTGDSARAYLDIKLFDAARIEVAWHSYQHPQYPQLHGEFIPYLSALDLLLNAGQAARNYLPNKVAGIGVS